MIPFPFQAAQFGIGGSESDPYWNSVVSLLHMDGANNGTSFIDAKGKTWTASGNAKISTTQSKWGGSSGLFDGTGDYVSATASADFAVGTGDFTVECWLYLAATSAIARGIADTRANSANTTGWYFGTFGTLAQFFIPSGANINGGTITINTWSHMAAVRISGTVYLYLDGTQVASGACTNNFTEQGLWLGTGRAGTGLTDEFNGHIEEFRLTKGVGRYTGNFAVPTSPFPNS